MRLICEGVSKGYRPDVGRRWMKKDGNYLYLVKNNPMARSNDNLFTKGIRGAGGKQSVYKKITVKKLKYEFA